MKSTASKGAEMNAAVTVKVEQMKFSESQRWNRETLPAADCIERGSFFPGGPSCLVAYDANGQHLQTITESETNLWS